MAISSNNMQTASGINVCANPIANIDINVGFQPDWVEVWNPSSDFKMSWFYGMPQGSGRFEAGNIKHGVISSARCVIGSTASSVANGAFYMIVNGVRAAKAAVVAGTAPTATTIPINLWGLFGFEIVAAGTITALDAAANATGYATEALAIAAIPAQTANKVFFMYVTVMSTISGGFVGATSLFSTVGVTAHFVSVIPYAFPQTLGITQLNVGNVTTGTRGFRIGVNTDLQIAGDTLYWSCGGGR